MNFFRENLILDLRQRIDTEEELERKLDLLREFKSKHFNDIKKNEINDENLAEIFSKLSDLADATLTISWEMALDALSKTYGFPTFLDNDGNLLRSQFAVIGMGKLGGREIHYGSDLDLIFLYNRNGDTEGRKVITNREFYIRATQKMISFLTVPTFRGVAYAIDTQLRPSGNQGALVSPLDSYADYQRNVAQAWEKQALLKARAVTGDESFLKILPDHFRQFIFSTDFPSNLNEEIHRLRTRMEIELAKETPRRWHYKKGYGSLTDIEFAVQYLQLKMGKIFEFILDANTLQAIEKMGERDILKKEEYDILKKAYLFYRKLELHLETQFELKEGYLDPESHLLENIAESMGEFSAQSLIEHFDQTRHDVRKTYLRILKIS